MALLLVLVAVGVLYATGQLTTVERRLLGQTTAVTYQTATVAKGTVAETVPATGPISAAITLPLTFKEAGKLVDLKVAIGQKVKKGDLLAQLDTTDLQAAVDQAKANLSQQQSNYNKLKAGATPEQVQAAEVALQNAQQAANDAAQSATATQASASKDVEAAQASTASTQGAVQTARDALAAAQDQAQKKLAADQTAIDNAQKALDASKQVVGTSPAILKQQLEKAKDDLWAAQINRDTACSRGGGGPCDAAKATVAGLETAVTNFNATAQQTQKQNDQTVQQAQNAVDTAKAALATDQAAQAAAIKTAENAVHAAEAQLNTSQVGIEQAQVKAAASAKSAQQTANNAQAQVKTAQASLATTAAPTTQAELDAQMAAIANSLVAVKTAENNLVAATLVAPMDGTVTAITGVVGQQINGGTATTGSSSSSSTTSSSATGGFITLATLDDLQVTANVNEADVGKIKIGEPVSFTVSAFPGKTFSGQVTQLQPTGTTTSNVVNFAVTSSIKSVEGTALYPGMTANVTITAAEHKDVMLVPNSALTFARTFRQSAAAGSANAQGATGTTGGNGQRGAGAASPGGQRPAGANAGGQAAAGANAGATSADGQAAQAGGQGGGQSRGQSGAQGGSDGTPAFIVMLQNGQPVPARVTTGMTDGTSTEIISGLQEGQAIVTGQTAAGAASTTGSGAAGGAGQRAPQSTNPLTGGGPGPGFRGG